MSGPRVSSGTDSKQDFRTPPEFMAAVNKRFGPVQVDLAAHAGNAQHARYIAPREFVTTGPLKMFGLKDTDTIPPDLVHVKNSKKLGRIFERRVKNVDPGAYVFDAFAHSWAELSAKFPRPDGGPGLLWLNCEFGDIARWAERCLAEMAQGANTMLLTPVYLSDWFRTYCAGRADTYLLVGRLCFNGEDSFPSDCMVNHFHPGAPGRIALWDWQRDELVSNGLWLPADARKDLEAA